MSCYHKFFLFSETLKISFLFAEAVAYYVFVLLILHSLSSFNRIVRAY
jgi:hypothetical protein